MPPIRNLDARLRAEAARRARAAILPERQEIIRQRQAAARLAAEQQDRLRGMAEAAARLLGEQTPQVSQSYGQAVSAQQGLASGFSGDMRARLANVPGAQAGPTADAAYTLGGYIPGSHLASDALAATRIAAARPAEQLGLGQIAARRAAYDQRVKDAEYGKSLTDLAGKIPGIQGEYLDALRKYELDKLATSIQAQYLGLNTRKTIADITGVDPETGVPTPDTANAAAKANAEKLKNRQKAVANRNKALTSMRRSAKSEINTILSKFPAPNKSSGSTGSGNPYRPGGSKAATPGAKPDIAEIVASVYLSTGAAEIAARYGVSPTRLRQMIRSQVVNAMRARGYKVGTKTTKPRMDVKSDANR